MKTTPSTTSEKSTATEEKILRAALVEFAANGKNGARMQSIADSAEVNKALLHYYFRSKDKLYAAVFEYNFNKFVVPLSASLDQTETFAEFFELFVYSYVDFLAGQPDVVRLIVNDNLSGGRTMRDNLKLQQARSTIAPAPMLFLMRLQRAIDEGEVRSVDPFQTLVTTLSACMFFVIMFPVMAALKPGIDRESFVAQRKQHVVDLLTNGLIPKQQ